MTQTTNTNKYEGMDLINVTKGRISETLLKTILGSAGYHVIPFGVETFTPSLTKNEYKELPEKIRTMPDFLVIEPGVDKEANPNWNNNWLVEVKYVKEWNDKTKTNLCRKLKNQLKFWDEIYLLLFVARHNPKYSNTYSKDRPYDINIGIVKLWLDFHSKEDWDKYMEGENKSECKSYNENRDHGNLMFHVGRDGSSGGNRWHDEFNGLDFVTSIRHFFRKIRDDESSWTTKLNKCAELIKSFPAIFDNGEP